MQSDTIQSNDQALGSEKAGASEEPVDKQHDKPASLIPIDHNDGSIPSRDDMETLPRVCDNIPYTIFYVVVAEVAERFAFRSLTGPLQNYVQNPFHGSELPGALDKGQATATAIGYFFQCWCYLTPILGAIVADTWLGRFKTILIGTTTATLGMAVLFTTSLPVSLKRGGGFPGLIVALVIIGLGAGGIKSNVGPLVAKQYANKKPRIGKDSHGLRVIIDPDVTVQTIFARYYWTMNIGSCAGLIATWVERKVGFWAVFLIALCVYAVAIVALIVGRKKYVAPPPEGSVVLHGVHALWIGLKNDRTMDKAKPSILRQQAGAADVPWNDQFVDELKVALIACRVLSLFPLFWLCYGNTVGNVISLAGKMNTLGLPNDFCLSNLLVPEIAGFENQLTFQVAGSINPLSILVLLPLFEKVFYPALRRWGVPFRPVTRIAVGFFVMSGAIAIAAALQSLVHRSPPNSVNFFSILPIYVMTALAEILAFLSSMEYAYTKAPSSMKSLVASINLLLCAVGSALGIALSPASTWNRVMVQFACLSATMFTASIVFYLLFSRYNGEEEKLNRLEREAEGSGNAT